MLLKRKYIIIFIFIILYICIRRQLQVDNGAGPILDNQFLHAAKNKSIPSLLLSNIHKYVTLFIRFSGNQHSVNFITKTIDSFLSMYPDLNIIIISDFRVIPMPFNNSSHFKNVKLLILNLDLINFQLDRDPLNYAKTKYMLVVPEGSLAVSPQILQKLLILYEERCCHLAIPVHQNVECLLLKENLREWTLEYKTIKDQNLFCDAVKGDHGIFTEVKMFKRVGDPFLLPFPESLYIQNKLLNIKTRISDVRIKAALKISQKEKQKSELLQQNHRTLMNMKFKIKKIVRETGLIEWYGCTRNTSRCFSDIVNSMPRYIYEGRWTPPCCLKVLRETARHTFKVLEKSNVRYWLEGGSLLGAMRSGDIIPWDYDVDIGIYKEDIKKCPWLRKVQALSIKSPKAIIDNEGYVWEKSKPDEGNFYRVQASVTNRLHVDIFPFYSRNNIMTKETWFPTHPQDKEFPEHYLKPFTTIDFIGMKASAPNNIREFLEFKFGKGVIENPKYPNPKLASLPADYHYALKTSSEPNEILEPHKVT